MDALVQFFTTVAVVMTTTALSHFGVTSDEPKARESNRQGERTVKRTPVPQASVVLRLPH